MARLKQQDKANAQIVLAWRIEEIRVRTLVQKRLPDLRTLLVGQAPVRQTPDEQRAIMHRLAEQYGLAIVTRPKDMN